MPTISPLIFGDTVKVIFETSKVAESVECQLVNIDDNSIVPVSSEYTNYISIVHVAPGNNVHDYYTNLLQY